MQSLKWIKNNAKIREKSKQFKTGRRMRMCNSSMENEYIYLKKSWGHKKDLNSLFLVYLTIYLKESNINLRKPPVTNVFIFN